MSLRIGIATVFMAGIASFSWSQLATTSAQDDTPVVDEKSERQQFMRSKLSMVHKIVEGIATEDYALIEKGGIQLVTLAESAAWKSNRDPYYRHYSANFEHAGKGLIEAAKSKSVEKATFAYVHVTFSCTACHQHVRGIVRISH